MSASTSEEDGQAHHNVGVYFGGRETETEPHDECIMQQSLST